jgi:hypothetical protein
MAEQALARLAMLDGDASAARALLETTNATAVRAGDPLMELSSLRGLAAASAVLGNLDESSRLLATALEVARRLGDARIVASVLADVAQALIKTGELGRAEAAARECLSIAGLGCDIPGQAKAMMVLGRLAARTGRHRRAMVYFRRSLATLQRSGYDGESAPRRTLVLTLVGLAASLAGSGETRCLHPVLGAIDSLRRSRDVVLSPDDEALLRALVFAAGQSGAPEAPDGMRPAVAIAIALAAVNRLGTRSRGA